MLSFVNSAFLFRDLAEEEVTNKPNKNGAEANPFSVLFYSTAKHESINHNWGVLRNTDRANKNDTADLDTTDVIVGPRNSEMLMT